MSYSSKSNFSYFSLGFQGFCTYLYEIIKKKEYGIQIRQTYRQRFSRCIMLNRFGFISGIK
jgi:hypothetical protein